MKSDLLCAVAALRSPTKTLVSGSSGKESTGGLSRLRQNVDAYPQNLPVAFEARPEVTGFVYLVGRLTSNQRPIDYESIAPVLDF